MISPRNYCVFVFVIVCKNMFLYFNKNKFCFYFSLYLGVLSYLTSLLILKTFLFNSWRPQSLWPSFIPSCKPSIIPIKLPRADPAKIPSFMPSTGFICWTEKTNENYDFMFPFSLIVSRLLLRVTRSSSCWTKMFFRWGISKIFQY